MRGLLMMFLMLAAWLPALPAQAVYISLPDIVCEGEPFVSRPSSFDLTILADAIVVATVKSGSEEAGWVTMNTDRVLKGKAPEKFRLPVGFQYNDIESPDSGKPCTDFSPQEGESYLLYLKENGSDVSIMRLQEAHIAVKHDSKKPFIVNLVSMYVDIQNKLSPENQLLFLNKELQNILHLRATEEEQYKARHIMDYLGSASPFMPTEHLVRLYTLSDHGKIPSLGLRSDRKLIMAPWSDLLNIAKLMKSTILGNEYEIENAKNLIISAIAEGNHPNAIEIFKNLIENDNSIKSIKICIKYYISIGNVDEAVNLIENYFSKHIEQYDILKDKYPYIYKNRYNLIADMASDFENQLENKYKIEGNIAITERWPRALLNLLITIRINEFSRTRGWKHINIALSRLNFSEYYYDRNKSTLVLSYFGSENVIEISKKNVKILFNSNNPVLLSQEMLEENYEYDELLPYASLILGREDKYIKTIFNKLYCDDISSLLYIIDLYREYGENYEPISSLLASNLDERFKAITLKTLISLHARNVEDESGKYYIDMLKPPSGRSSPFVLLEAAMRGEKGPGTPFTCPAPPLP